MNLVADEGVDAPIVRRLRADGHTVWYVAELSPSVPDEDVLAVEQGFSPLPPFSLSPLPPFSPSHPSSRSASTVQSIVSPATPTICTAGRPVEPSRTARASVDVVAAGARPLVVSRASQPDGAAS